MFELSLFSIDAIANFSMKMLVFLAGLAALIFVHELGHFLVARKFGVIVEKFSLGFGPKVYGFTKGDTEYLLSAIPLGGYVKMKGEDYEESSVKEPGSFAAADVKHRIAIAFAGPLFNFLFAVAIYVVVYLVGVPTLSLVTGEIRDESPALVAGIQTGDKIVEIDGDKVQFWDQLQKKVHASPGIAMQFKVERGGKLIDFTITPISEEITNMFGEKEHVGLIGITPMVQNISYIKEGSPAENSGLQIGDRLIKVDETTIRGWGDLKPAAVDKPGQELSFTVIRDGQEVVVKLTPESKVIKDEEGKNVEIGVIGIGMSGEMISEEYGLFGAIQRSVEETGRLIYLIALSIKKLIVGSVPADQIGGPILIFQIYGEQAEQGFNQLIRITALLSINLGLLNLLPIPVLDGGHIFFFLIEMIKGRPVSERNRERASQVGLFMLLGLMVFAFYNDIVRIIS